MIYRKKLLVLFCLLIMGGTIVFNSCKKEHTDPTILVETKAGTNIWPTVAFTGGTITGDDEHSIFERGIYWDTLMNPEQNGQVMIALNESNDFTSMLTGLKPNTMYYVKAYAKNSESTFYGNAVVIKTTDNAAYAAPCSVDLNELQWGGWQFPLSVSYGTAGMSMGAYGFSGSGSSCDIEIAFSAPPVTGKYITAGYSTSYSFTECVVSGVFFSEWQVSASGDTVYVTKNGEGAYSVSFCDVHFSPSGYPSDISTSGNLTTD